MRRARNVSKDRARRPVEESCELLGTQDRRKFEDAGDRRVGDRDRWGRLVRCIFWGHGASLSAATRRKRITPVCGNSPPRTAAEIRCSLARVRALARSAQSPQPGPSLSGSRHGRGRLCFKPAPHAGTGAVAITHTRRSRRATPGRLKLCQQRKNRQEHCVSNLLFLLTASRIHTSLRGFAAQFQHSALCWNP